jgi:hypothetical protein
MRDFDHPANWDPMGQWSSRYGTRAAGDDASETRADAAGYGAVASYQLAAIFLEDCHDVEDWGCGFGTFSRYCLSPHYVGIDGSESPAADAVVDLRTYRSDVEGILVRHVLEHNPTGWRQIFTNAIESFSKKMVLVIYTPFGDVTRNIRRRSPTDIWVPVAMSFRKDDLVGCIPPEVSWFTLLGEPLSAHETMFFLQRGGERRTRSSRQDVAYCPNFSGDP